MFTVEHHTDSTEIVLMDTAQCKDKDVRVFIQGDDRVYLRQECLDSQRVDVVEMDWKMLVCLAQSLGCDEGFYTLEQTHPQITEE